MSVQADCSHALAKKLREAGKQIRSSKKGLRQLGEGNLAGMTIGEDTLNDMEVRERNNEKRAAGGRLGVRVVGGRKQQLRRGTKNAVTYYLYLNESVLWLLPGAQLLFALRVVWLIESYHLPLTLSYAPSIISPHSLSLRMRPQMTPSYPLKSLRNIAPAHTQGLGRNPSPPPPRRLCPTETLVTPPQQLTTIASLLRD